MNLYPSLSKNPILKNFTQNKNIKLNGTFSKTININTNVGKKSVIESEIKWSFDNFLGEIGEIAYSKELGLLVAVGNNNLIMTSSDGINWEFQSNIVTPPDFFSSFNITCVIYSEVLHKFIAGGGAYNSNSPYIFTSSNGKDWDCNNISISEGYDSRLNCIVYSENLNLFVAVGERAGIFTSSDCITWTKREVLETTEDLISIAYSESLGKFIACSLFEHYILSSTDGINWTSTYNEDLNGYVVYSEQKQLFLMGIFKIATSVDGINWEFQDEIYNPGLSGISYQEKLGLFFIFWNNYRENEFHIKTSSDGINWQDTISDSLPFNDLIFFNKDGFFINYNLYTSNDGFNYVNPKKVIGITETINFTKIIYSEKLNKYLAVGTSSYAHMSIDGIIWEKYRISENNLNISDIIYINELDLFFAVSYMSLAYICKSVDGVNWTTFEAPYLSYFEKSNIIYSKKQNKLIILSSSTEYISVDGGINWEYQQNPFSSRALAYSENLNLFISFSGVLEYRTSVDGVNWEFHSFGQNYTVFNAIYSEELKLFIVLCQGVILTSPDGINWEECILENINLIDVIYSNELRLLIACGNHNKKGCFATSSDGKNWNVEDLQTNSGISSVAENTKNINFCIVGSESKILNSINIDSKNIIDKLSDESDLSLGLNIGENELLLNCEEGNLNGVVTYRQKYIGV